MLNKVITHVLEIYLQRIHVAKNWYPTYIYKEHL